MRKVEQKINGHVYGQVAGGDIHYIVQEAVIVPCSTCEYRVVVPGQKECRHCGEARKNEEFRNAATAAALGFFVLAYVGHMIAQRLGLMGAEALETGLAIGFLLILFVVLLYLSIMAWVNTAPTQEVAMRRHLTAVLLCGAPGLACLVAAEHVPDVMQGWAFGYGFFSLIFSLVLLRKKPAIF